VLPSPYRVAHLLARQQHDLHSLQTVDSATAVPSLRLPELAVLVMTVARNMIDTGATHQISLTGANASADNAVTLIASEHFQDLSDHDSSRAD